MSYIYLIKNEITSEKYVGNTSFDIIKRWNEHCHDATKKRCSHRPLYVAINKYGKKNFTVEVLEECDSTISSEREKYWIETLDTFKNGYNCTYGGKGKAFVDYDELYNVYDKTKSIKATAALLNISTYTVSDALNRAAITKLSMKEKMKPYSKPVCAISKNGEESITFQSIHEASEWILKSRPYAKSESAVRSHIVRACNSPNEHKKMTAYGYYWKFATVV